MRSQIPLITLGNILLETYYYDINLSKSTLFKK